MLDITSVFLQDPGVSRVKERPAAPSPVQISPAPQAPVQGELSHNLCWSHHSHVFFVFLRPLSCIAVKLPFSGCLFVDALEVAFG